MLTKKWSGAAYLARSPMMCSGKPEQIVFERAQRKAYQSRVGFGDGKVFLVRLIVDETANPAVVVTAYRTSKIEKFGGSNESDL